MRLLSFFADVADGGTVADRAVEHALVVDVRVIVDLLAGQRTGVDAVAAPIVQTAEHAFRADEIIQMVAVFD